MSDFRTIFSVVHKKHFEFFGIMYQEFVKSIGQKVSRLCIRTVSDGRLRDGAFEASANSGIDTFLFAP